MSLFLALDIGLRRTGLAFGDDTRGFVVALDTLKHTTMNELATQVSRIASEKNIDGLVVGLPRLPSGEEGEQAGIVRSAIDIIKKKTELPLSFIDERYTSIEGKGAPRADPDARAACEILTVFLLQERN